MTLKQRLAAQAAASLALITLLWPPWQYREPDVYGGIHSDPAARGLHFSFVANVPYAEASLNVAVLGIEIGVIVALALLIVLALGRPSPGA